MLQISTTYVEPNLGERKNVARLGLNLRPVNTPTIRPMARRQFDEPITGFGNTTLNNGSNGYDFHLLNQSKKRLLQPPQLNPRVQGELLDF
jgi:hypothetical protein